MKKEKIYVIGHKHPDTDSYLLPPLLMLIAEKGDGMNYGTARARGD